MNIYLSIIIPVYNEEESLNRLAKKLKSILENLNKSWEIIFIDDGSNDKGFEIVSNLAKEDHRIKVIKFRKNFGQTAALSAGFNCAQGEIIIPMDADLENDPNDIPRLLEKINQGYDLVSGWRKKRWKDNPLTKRMTSLSANWLISKVTGVKLHDYGCTMKAYRKEIIKSVKLYGEMHRFIPALASWQGAKIGEIEVKYQPREFGKSKYGLERIGKVILDLITVKFLSGYATKPIYFFGKLGFISFFIGIFAFFLATYYKLTGQKDYIQTPLPIFTALFLIAGILLILIGLLAEMIMRNYHESQNKQIYSIKEKINF
ncbi:MAG: dolichol-phosphate mannosyltransferase [Parcubacteria group bacterium Athens0714_12]|nr:MAG: dolichol-phosphate mannosyltransferase [Parcubacteria group bacterium Athens0714_12]